MILSDFDLRAYLTSRRLRVEPFSEEIIRENGLDLRIGEGFCRINTSSRELSVGVDSVEEYFTCGRAEEYLRLESSTHYLLHTIEYLRMPPELMGFVELRSTFARLGFIMPPTIVDAGFEGQLTIEVLTPPYPVKIAVGTRFLHVVFAKVATPATSTYRGKYQGQRGVVLPRW
ncbi:MAG: dCTP deaminase [Sulfolobales archaeon]|nr:dCTP deaminase [Sulfolobales archaeon]MCX8208136.1 dCTP deaminase [Sulfolobales archaeon]MDW8010285.1 dCTP deaminase [Sulfolobales archaeon]